MVLTHWGRVTHICVGKQTTISSDNGLSPPRQQAIIGTNAGMLLIRIFGTNFSEILIEIYTFSFNKIHVICVMATILPRPQCVRPCMMRPVCRLVLVNTALSHIVCSRIYTQGLDGHSFAVVILDSWQWKWVIYQIPYCGFADIGTFFRYIKSVCQKQISRTGICNYTPQILWDANTCSCPWYLLLALHIYNHTILNYKTYPSTNYVLNS